MQRVKTRWVLDALMVLWIALQLLAIATIGCGGGEFTAGQGISGGAGGAAGEELGGAGGSSGSEPSGGQAGSSGGVSGSGGIAGGGSGGEPPAGSAGAQGGSAGVADKFTGFPEPLGIECGKCLPVEFTNNGLCEDRYVACVADKSNKGCEQALNCVAACLKGPALFSDCLNSQCWSIYPMEIIKQIDDVYSCVCCASQCVDQCSSFCASVTGVYGPSNCVGYDGGSP